MLLTQHNLESAVRAIGLPFTIPATSTIHHMALISLILMDLRLEQKHVMAYFIYNTITGEQYHSVDFSSQIFISTQFVSKVLILNHKSLCGIELC